jgi:CRP-like cAMP-binding protein
MPAALRKSAKHAPFAQGEPIFRLGDPPRAMLYLLAGEVRLVRRSRGGVEIVLQRSRGGFFAEASLESHRYHCDAVAAEPGELLRFPTREFRQALADDTAFRDGWIRHLESEVRRLRAQCERLSLNSAAERIVHYVESEGTGGAVVLTETKKAWAAELGLSHEALYRTLRGMQRQDLLTIEGHRVSLRSTAVR